MSKRKSIVFIGLIFLLSFSVLQAQITRQSGMVRGVVRDAEGIPLPGVTITLAGPSMMGKATDVTREDGSFRLPAVPPGTYTLTAELQGFKTLTMTEVIVRVGLTVTLDLKMEPATLEEQVTVVAKAPEIDVQKTKITTAVTSEEIVRLPLNRSLTNVLNLVPSTVGTISTYSGSIHGTLWRGVAYEVDGINANCPTTGGAFGTPQFDAIEEIEVVTGGLPAQVGTTGGAFVNIVTKSGGNTFSGQVQAFYTNDDLAQVLFPDEKLKAMKIGKPSFSLYDIDTSAMLGGPIIKDRLWFFTDFAFTKSSRWSPFRPVTILGQSYDQYKIPSRNFRGSIKLTTEISKNLRFYTYFSLSDSKNMYEAWSNKTEESTFWSKPAQYVGTANLTWIVSPNSFIDFRININHLDFPITARPESKNNISFQDGYTGYIWNGIQSWESYMTRHTSQASARLTHFQDNFLGGNHEIGAGLEFQYGWDRYAYARTNPMNWFYWDGNPYYWRGYYGVDEPTIFGDGRLSFTNCGIGRDDSWKDLKEYRIGGYFQDNWTIKNRLTINLGLRIDHYNGWGGKAESTGITGLPFEIGETLEPQIGFNPFGPFEVEPIKDVLVFTNISPRIGLSYDLFGNGKTALKLSYAHYSEQVPVMWFSEVSPAVMAQYEFNWWDDNQNGQPDSPDIDHYEYRWSLGDFKLPDPEYLRSLVDPSLVAPVHKEFIAGIEHQLFKDLAIKLSYVHKKESKVYGWAKYDPETDQYWYKLEQVPEWYVPFSTIVPAYDAFPEQEVTVYFMKADSAYDRSIYIKTNIPEQFRKYNGLELQFDKRYSHGWSLGGGLVLSKTTYFECGDSPNDFINAPGRDGYDIPFQFKLYGTFDLPYGFVTSFFLRYSLGSPWARSVTIVPPSDWAEANNVVPWDVWVRLEPNGSRRNEDSTSIDFHLEKAFKLPYGNIAAFVDIYNVFGFRNVSYGLNPISIWRPESEGTNIGSYTLDYNYQRVTGISATRVFKFSVRYRF
ncbi:MAG: TonB-dependent receptor [Acidobacteriota bacterium]|nr:TonB-dependent receptor [Acidobacteriota bacterium]MDW3228755.1 TonB-dependent receptor [Acidobacteriota bacterium]MDY0231312.1 TonB-dependent receptor [Candidatus Saccharicenans sp.]